MQRVSSWTELGTELGLAQRALTILCRLCQSGGCKGHTRTKCISQTLSVQVEQLFHRTLHQM
jgi:hypothetical protein